MVTARQRSALSSLRSVARDTGAFLSALSNVSERLAERTSETVIGTFGGVVGAIAGYAISLPIHQLASQGVCLSLGSVLGITLATILWRGPQNMLAERRDRRRERLFLEHQSFVADQIKKLGKACPPELIEYQRQLPMEFIKQRHGLHPSDPFPSLPPPPRQLPPHNVDTSPPQ